MRIKEFNKHLDKILAEIDLKESIELKLAPNDYYYTDPIKAYWTMVRAGIKRYLKIYYENNR